jgi:DNA polymerase V
MPRCFRRANGVYVKRDFEWYEVLSRKMLVIVRELSPHVEFYSIDESFFRIHRPTLQVAQRLQQLIKEQVGVPVSVGIAPPKTLAKLISDAVKPYGCGIALRSAAEYVQWNVERGLRLLNFSSN